MNLHELSLTAAAAAIRSGNLSPVDYAKALVSRIDALEPLVQAWVDVQRDAVLKEAKQCEDEARGGRFRGPLHGVPIGVKDVFCTKGQRTTMGSLLFRDYVPDHDARAVTKLREAGAIVLGKTVTTAFAFLDPGPTRNPWNLDHTPGGSSSGSAAAVAARMCPAAIGSQTVGSIGRPAAFNGLVSMMPTQARISRAGAFPLAWSLDHVGAFTRSVADLDLILNALSESPVDHSDGRRKFRIGILREFFYANADAEARTLHDAFASTLTKAGFEVSELPLPARFDLAHPALRTILRSEAASVHKRLFAVNPGAFGAKLGELIETGSLIEASDYLRARRLRRVYQREMLRLFDNVDVLLTPAARGAAPHGVHATGDPIMNAPWTLADFPTMTIPHALTVAGLPVAVQLSAPPMKEGLLLTVARRAEEVADFNPTPHL